jgi:hypothetical protein
MCAPTPLGSPNFNGRWYHCISTTYGAWLPGDPRGYRTRRHREHVDGDYNNPPPTGAHEAKLQRSQRLLKQPAVQIPTRWRSTIGTAVREKLVAKDGFVLCVAVALQHVHVLVKLPASRTPRHWMGLARKHATFEVRNRGWKGKLWGIRGKELPIKDRQHQMAVYQYILNHAAQGAWVWDWRQEHNRTTE